MYLLSQWGMSVLASSIWGFSAGLMSSCDEQTHVSEQGIASPDIPFWICLLIELLQRNIIIIFSNDKQDRDVELMSVLSFTENSCVATRKS